MLHTSSLNRNASYVCYASGNDNFTVCDVMQRKPICQRLPDGLRPHLVRFCDTDANQAPDNIVVMAVANREQEAHTLVVWDHMKQDVHLHQRLSSPILGLAANPKWVVVAQRNKTTCHDLTTLHTISSHVTADNPRGLCAVGVNGPVVCLGQVPGSVLVMMPNTTETKLIPAFPKEHIGQLCLDNRGRYLAVSNEYGSIVHIYNVQRGERIHEFRRGLSSANVTSMCFDGQAKWLCLFSDHNTVHLFGVGEEQKNYNQRSKLYYISPILPKYFHSSWSAANFPLETEKSAIVGFQPNDRLCIIAQSGYCYIYQWDIRESERPTAKLVTRYLLPNVPTTTTRKLEVS